MRPWKYKLTNIDTKKSFTVTTKNTIDYAWRMTGVLDELIKLAKIELNKDLRYMDITLHFEYPKRAKRPRYWKPEQTIPIGVTISGKSKPLANFRIELLEYPEHSLSKEDLDYYKKNLKFPWSGRKSIEAIEDKE